MFLIAPNKTIALGALDVLGVAVERSFLRQLRTESWVCGVLEELQKHATRGLLVKIIVIGMRCCQTAVKNNCFERPSLVVTATVAGFLSRIHRLL